VDTAIYSTTNDAESNDVDETLSHLQPVIDETLNLPR